MAVGASAEGESAREGSLPPSPPSLTAAAAPGLCSLTGILPRSPLPLAVLLVVLSVVVVALGELENGERREDERERERI